MKYLHTSMMGSYNIDCELIRQNEDGTIDIKYIDLVTDEETEETVDIDQVTWEMKDRFDHTLEIELAEGVVKFKEPVVVGWFGRYSDDVGSWVEYEYDFGMTCKFSFETSFFLGIKPEMSDEEVIRRLVEFDLAHAFDHPQEDPNYNYLHWALYGNLKNRFDKVLEPEFKEEKKNNKNEIKSIP